MTRRVGPSFVVLANPEGNRLALFQAALRSLGHPPARVVSWIGFLNASAHLAGVVRAGDVVRIESPGRDFEVQRRLLALGADAPDEVGATFARAARSAVEALPFDKGRILWPRQWFLGFRAALQRLRAQLRACPPHARTNDPDDVAVMFDKPACHARLRSAGVAVPPALTPLVRSFDELTSRMRDAACPRVFVKLAHGSSASGVVAYRTDGRRRQQAITTVEVVPGAAGDEPRLYNSRRVRTITDPRAIATLIDALCRHHVHVERWLPKAGIAGRTFDLRVLTIAGRARHTVVRTSRTPMTNLHLLNRRGDVDAVRARMGVDAWDAAVQTCERAAACFPRSLHAGVDLLVDASFRRHAVLEVNAFGDLLPGVTCGGRSTYEAEVEAVLDAPAPGTAGPARNGAVNRSPSS